MERITLQQLFTDLIKWKNGGVIIGWIDGQEDGSEVCGGNGVVEESMFEIGSLTKVFTALLLIRLKEKGVVSLKTSISDILDDVTFDDPVVADITLHELALHTSGLPRLPTNIDPADISDPYADYLREDLYAFLSHHTLDTDKKGQHDYSNLGYGLLGHVLERVTDSSFETLIRTHITQPLGMKDTYVTLPDEKTARLAAGHSKEGDEVTRWHNGVLIGDGGLVSTAPDLLLFLQAQLSPDQTDLSRAIKATHVPEGESRERALGWAINTESGEKVYWHNGQTGGYQSFFGCNPESKRAIAVLANCKIQMDDAAISFLQGE